MHTSTRKKKKKISTFNLNHFVLSYVNVLEYVSCKLFIIDQFEVLGYPCCLGWASC